MDPQQILDEHRTLDNLDVEEQERQAPLTELFPRGERVRRNITITPETDRLAHIVLSDRERSAAYELGILFVLFMHNQIVADKIVSKLESAFGRQNTQKNLATMLGWSLGND